MLQTAAAKYDNVVVKFKDAGGDSLPSGRRLKICKRGGGYTDCQPVEATPLTETSNSSF